MQLEQRLIQEIMPHARIDNIRYYLNALNSVLSEYEITTPLRVAHFLAQIGHESGSLRYTQENLNYSAVALSSVFGKYFPTSAMASDYARKPEKIANRVYADRMGNGDEASGDGWRYRGRGLIQLTGKHNYQQCGEAIGQDLLSQPELVCSDPDVAVRSACFYWQSRKLNALADQDELVTITRKINGGLHGLEDRAAFLNRAKQFMSIDRGV
ncbi:glycoside hydrolase family 19 protein [Pseudoalteromonas rubra]|uniref:glycoside hydrolase family 19 protein n=1 Tax=Pseudoalteromonas rubra TaxID=43658 RepID=UPI000697E1C6|nr:glycoside hydrolase family 19 protein [Pseudoalteromonas rubra]